MKTLLLIATLFIVSSAIAQETLPQTADLSGSASLLPEIDVVKSLLRSGIGVGVGAPQYGPRRGFYGGMSFDF